MDNPNIKTLNEILQGEHMAIESYESVLPAFEDQETRSTINRILNDHKRHAMEITDRIIALGGKPKESTGMPGLMSRTKLKTESLLRNEKDMLKKLYDGEDQGIAAVEKTIRGDLDAESLKIVHHILKTDHDHLKSLQKLIDQ